MYRHRKNESSLRRIPRHDDSDGNFLINEGELIGDRYILICALDKGTYGQVCRAFDRYTREEVAIKIIKNKRVYRETGEEEIRMLSRLNNIDRDGKGRIVRLLSHFVHLGHVCIVFELLSHSLFHHLRRGNFNGLSLLDTARIMLESLHFLSSPRLSIVHGDIKPENVMLVSANSTSIRLIDFGSSSVSGSRCPQYIQSRYWRSPEILLGLPFGPPIDIWSLGCMAIEILTGRPLFAGCHEKQQMALIVETLGMPPTKMVDDASKGDGYFYRLADGSHCLLPVISHFIPASRPLAIVFDEIRAQKYEESHYLLDMFEDLVSKMLRWEGGRRISPSEALDHFFFAHIDQLDTHCRPSAFRCDYCK